LYYDNVPFENNHAERIIRDGVIKRKNGYGNRSKNGTETQAILMSIFQTLKQRKLNPVNSFVNTLKGTSKNLIQPDCGRSVHIGLLAKNAEMGSWDDGNPVRNIFYQRFLEVPKIFSKTCKTIIKGRPFVSKGGFLCR
jgi:hypothetical protein